MNTLDLTVGLRSYNDKTHTHEHDYHQLVLPVTGELSMNVGNNGGTVCSQQIAVVAAGQEHDFAAVEQNCFVVADVPLHYAPDLERLPAFIAMDASLTHYVNFLYQQVSINTEGQRSEKIMLLLLIQLLKERYGDALRIDQRIEAARCYIDRHYAKTISLESLSRVANLSVRQLTELFRRELGVTPQQYIIEKRMQQAWQLLEEEKLSVQQVADKVGYHSVSSFSDRFRKHFGRSPRYFRQIDK